MLEGWLYVRSQLCKTTALQSELTFGNLFQDSGVEVHIWYQKMTVLVNVDGPVLQVEVLTSEKKELVEKVKSLSENIRSTNLSQNVRFSICDYRCVSVLRGSAGW